MKRYIRYLVKSICCGCGDTFTGYGFKFFYNEWLTCHIDCFDLWETPPDSGEDEDPDAHGA